VPAWGGSCHSIDGVGDNDELGGVANARPARGHRLLVDGLEVENPLEDLRILDQSQAHC